MFIKGTNKCKPCHNALNREGYKRNRDKILKRKKMYNKEYVRRENVKERRRVYKRTEKYKAYARNYANNKHKTNLIERLKTNIRNRIRHSVKKRNESSSELIGCPIELLIEWLEFNFDENMNWTNYGSYWHMDHIKPCSSFNLDDILEREKCFNWTNVAPMKASENESKHAKIDEELILFYNKRLVEFCNQYLKKYVDN
ncbi:intron encoded nuclease [Acanthamoeba polyphaga moumouvirus]|uniref:Intron encoded nuclease n=2 Tax=Moumouvirus TaxID=3080801 RepID=L7RCG4_9VIRU|nr:intron encoded nuclease [Acanthamoeba polyphaga moumouvirus]AGC01926.1 intron encoded nuclease [Acanthamoeba polyphaga moumouvirus]